MLVSTLPPSSALGRWVYFVYLFTWSAYAAAFCQVLVIQFFCSLRCPKAVSPTCCNSVAPGLHSAVPPSAGEPKQLSPPRVSTHYRSKLKQT